MAIISSFGLKPYAVDKMKFSRSPHVTYRIFLDSIINTVESERESFDLYDALRRLFLEHEYRPADGGYSCICGWAGASISEHLADRVKEVV